MDLCAHFPGTRSCLHTASRRSSYLLASPTPPLSFFPVVVALAAAEKQRGRLVCGARLHLVVVCLAMTALGALCCTHSMHSGGQLRFQNTVATHGCCKEKATTAVSQRSKQFEAGGCCQTRQTRLSVRTWGAGGVLPRLFSAKHVFDSLLFELGGFAHLLAAHTASGKLTSTVCNSHLTMTYRHRVVRKVTEHQSKHNPALCAYLSVYGVQVWAALA